MDDDEDDRENLAALGICLSNLCLDHESQKVGEEDDKASLGNNTTAPTTDTDTEERESLLAVVNKSLFLASHFFRRVDFLTWKRLTEHQSSHELAIEWSTS